MARPASPRLIEKVSNPLINPEKNQNGHRPGREDSAPEAVLATNDPGTRQRLEACRIVGYSGQDLYEIRRNFQVHGAEGLLDRLPGRRDRTPTASRPRSRRRSWPMRSSIPPTGAQRVADKLMLRGLQVSSGGVRGVRMRNGLKTRHERLLRLEETVRKRKIKLTEEQIQALERFDPEFRERHIEVHATGELVAVDTFFAGTLKGVGKVYIQTVLDCFSRHVWARLYTSKMPVTAVQILNNHVLPFFEE